MSQPYFEDFNKIYEYAAEHTSTAPSYLDELERSTHLNTLQPRMLSGAFQGRFLAMISKMIKPTYILEIGTFTGYSALCLAEGLIDNGELHTFEVNQELESIINNAIKNSPYPEKIKVHFRDAMEAVPTLQLVWDLVFIDASKKDYPNYLEMIMPFTKAGTMIIIDNVLWSGKVLNPSEDKDAQILDSLNKKIMSDERFEVVLLPIRDGISVIRVK